MGRIISVVLEIEDMDAARAIWAAHMEHTTVLGSRVLAIGDGNIFNERNQIEDLVEEIAEVAEKDIGNKIADEILELIEDRN